MKIILKIIEDKLQKFFEEQLHFFNDSDPFVQLSKDLLLIMEENIQIENEQKHIPNIYRISVRENKVIDSENLGVWKNFIIELINETSKMNHLNLSGPVHIQFFYNPKIDSEYLIETANSSFSSGKTVSMPTTHDLPDAENESVHAYLITPYDSIFPIQKIITNIGRNEDNDMVIDNLRVSRLHAQIREVDGRHLLFDLDSTTGTKVNGQRISQHFLSQGDVIDIGDVPLIYNHDAAEDIRKESKSTTKSFNLQENQR